MDTRTGRMYEVADEADAKARGLVPVPETMVQELKALASKQRLELLERLAVHPTAEMTQPERNFAKRIRRERAGK